MTGARRPRHSRPPQDGFYRLVCWIGRPIFKVVSRPVVLNPERGELEGGWLLASNHLAPYDVSCLINTTRRHIDWVSIVEMFKKPLVGWFFGSLNAMPLDRSRTDGVTVRTVIERLNAGRVVGIFPEGGLRRLEQSVISGGRFRSGVGRMAQMANVPIVPVAVLGTEAFSNPLAWLPLRRTRYGVAYGEPLLIREELNEKEARHEIEERWRDAVVALAGELQTAMEGALQD